MSNKVTIDKHTEDFMMTGCIIRQLEDAVRCLKDIEYFAEDNYEIEG